MITPATADFQIAARKPFPDKAAPSHQSNGGEIAGLNVSLEAMQLELQQCMPHHQQEPFTHEALPRVREKSVVTKERIVEGSTNNIVQVDDPQDFIGAATKYEKPTMRFGRYALQIRRKCLGRSRGGNPVAVQSTTATNSGQEC